MAKKYAKLLEDGSIDIASSVIKVGNKSFYHPTEKTLDALGYFELREVSDEAAEKEGYKIIDIGYHHDVDPKTGKKIVTNSKRYLKIVDNPPALADGLYIRNDYWKEIGDKWVHIYDVASSKRHKKHKDKHDEQPVEEGAQSASKFEEQKAAEELAKAEEPPKAEEPKEETPAEAPVEEQ